MKHIAIIILVLFVALGTGCVTTEKATKLSPGMTRIAILVPGAGGNVPEDFLIRNRKKFEEAGIQTIIATSPEAVVRVSSKIESSVDVFIVGMSRGAIQAAMALNQNPPVKGVVFVSANYRGIMKKIRVASHLPPTLAIHHELDKCSKTPVIYAPLFVKWAGGKATLKIICSKGVYSFKSCGPDGAHGFFGKDDEPIMAIIEFIQGRL